MIRRLAVALGLITFGVVSGAGTTFAGAIFDGPFVEPERDAYAVGDTLTITIGGFGANGVTVSICGNEGRRGSTDCNMAESEGVALDGLGVTTIAQMPIPVPPVACPCIVRVASSDSSEIAVAPITLTGYPDAPVVDPVASDRAITLTIFAEPAPDGLFDRLRSSLGGGATYDVTVTVKNRSTVAISDLALTGSVGEDETSVSQTIEIPPIVELEAGQTAQQVVRVELPGLTFGRSVWQVSARGAGESVTAIDRTSRTPVLLITLGVLLAIDVVVLIVRLIRRRLRRSRSDSPDRPGSPDEPLQPEWAGEPILVG